MKSNHRAAAVIIPASPNGAQSLHRLTAVPLPFQGRLIKTESYFNWGNPENFLDE